MVVALGVGVWASWGRVEEACTVAATAACTVAAKLGVATGVAVEITAGASTPQATAKSSNRTETNLAWSLFDLTRSHYYMSDIDLPLLQSKPNVSRCGIGGITTGALDRWEKACLYRAL